jgi:hypothetical protein
MQVSTSSAVTILPEELRESNTGCGLHGGMDKEFHAMICPHSPLASPNMWNENHVKIYPIRIDPIVHTIVRFDPVPVHIPRIRLIGAEASVDKNILDTSRPKCSDGSPQAL